MRLAWFLCLGVGLGFSACGGRSSRESLPGSENVAGARASSGGPSVVGAGGLAPSQSDGGLGGFSAAGTALGDAGEGGGPMVLAEAGSAGEGQAGTGGDLGIVGGAGASGTFASGGSPAVVGGAGGSAVAGAGGIGGVASLPEAAGASNVGGTAGNGGAVTPPKTVRVPADYPSIQTALDATGNGDVIVVSPGTYRENLVFNGKATRLVGEAGPGSTIIDGGLAGPVVRFANHELADSVLEGFTLRNGSEFSGAAVSISGVSPTIRHNIIEDNSGYVAGIEANISNSLIDSNLFRNNHCDKQSGSAVLRFYNESRGHIVNNVFIDNDCLAIHDGGAEVVNNTFVDNRVAIFVFAGADWVRTRIYRNNLIVGGDRGLEVDYGTGLFPDYSNAPVWEHNLVFGASKNYLGIADPTGTNGNLSVNPALVAAETGDVHLLPISPAIDAGIEIGSWSPVADFDGSGRRVDGDGDGVATIDIGAEEFHE